MPQGEGGYIGGEDKPPKKTSTEKSLDWGAANIGGPLIDHVYGDHKVFDAWADAYKNIQTVVPNLDQAGQDRLTHQLLKTDLADRMGLKAEAIKDIFSHVTQSAAQNAPGTLAWAGVAKADPRLAVALSDAVDFFTSLFGSDQTSAFLSTFAITDKVSQEKTLALVKDITGWTEPTPEVGQGFVGRGGVASSLALDPEQISATLTQVIEAENPKELFDSLPASQQQQIWDAANQLIEQSKGMEAVSKSTLHILQTGDYQSVWTEDDAKKADAFVKAAEGTWAGGVNELTDIKKGVDAATERRGQKNLEEARLNRMLGIEQVKAIEDGQLVMNEEWAKQNPDRALALRLYLQETYPDVQIVLGKHGIVAGVLDGLGRLTETIAAPFGAAYAQAGELVEGFNFGPFSENRPKMIKRLVRLEKGIKEGTIAEEDWDSTLHEIDNLREDLNSDLGLNGFIDEMKIGVSAATPGMGFGENFAHGMGINPGDTGYEAVAGVAALASQIYFDPLNAIFSGIQGWRSLSKFVKPEGITRDVGELTQQIEKSVLEKTFKLPKGRTAEDLAQSILKATGVPKMHGYMANRIMKNIATPSEMAVTYGFQQAHETLWKTLQAVGPDAFQDIIVDYVGLEKAAFFKTARSKADLADMMVRSMQGRAGSLRLLDSWKFRQREAAVELNAGRALRRRIADLEAAVIDVPSLEGDLLRARAELDASGFVGREAQLLADKYYYNSVLRDAHWDNAVPMPSARALKRIDKLTETRSSWDEAVVQAATEGKDLVRNPKGWQRLSHPFRNWGEGKIMAFDHPSVLGSKNENIGILNSIKYYRNFMKELGWRDPEIQRMLHPWITGELAGDQQAQFTYWNKLWKETIEGSNLDKAVQERISTYYEAREGVRSAGDIAAEGGGTIPANFDQAKLGPDGKLLPGEDISGFPLNTAGEIDFAPRIPSADMMAEIRRFTSRHHSFMEKIGLKPKIIERGLQDSSKVLDEITNAWKNAVMLPRLAGPLPLRIGIEQQFRIWAFGQGRFRPGEWFSHFRANMTNEEILLNSEVPNHLLGGMVDAMLHRGRAARKSDVVTYGDKEFANAVNSALERWLDSPEFEMWHKGTLGDIEASWARMNDPKAPFYQQELAKKFVSRYVDQLHYADPKQALENAQKNILEMIGHESPGARFLQDAIANGGRATAEYGEHADKIVKVGTREFSEALNEYKKLGEWNPILRQIPTGSMNYIPMGNSWTKFKDFMYRWGYTNPDLAASRGPLFRTMATKEFNYYHSLGYDFKRAMQLSQESAAARTADIMFEIGGHTSGEHFIRNIAPFFPAWRELAKTWLIRVPKELGGLETAGTVAVRQLGWGLGTVRLARRADILADAASGAGMLSKDQYGNTVVGLGGFGDAINGIFGTDINFHVADFKLDSLFGIFPVPLKIFDEDLTLSERLRGLPPTLGSPASMGLEALADVSGWKFLRNVQGFVSPFGGDSSFMGANVDNLLIGLGFTPIWMSNTTREFSQSMQMSARLEGQRYFFRNNPPPPQPEDWDEWGPARRDNWTLKVLAPYAQRMIDAGENYMQAGYLKKAFWGAVSPISFTQTDDGIEELSKMWNFLAPFRGTKVYNDLASRTIQTFLRNNPDMEAWMTGKYFDGRTDDSGDEHSYSSFVESLKAGDIEIKTAEDFAAALYGNNVRSFHYRRKENILKRLKNEPDPVYAYLTQPHWKKQLDRQSEILSNFDEYMNTPGSLLPNQKTPYTAMRLQLEMAKAKRLGDYKPIHLTQKQQDFSELNDLRGTLDKYVKLDPEAIETQRYYQLQSKIAEKTSALYGNSDPFYRAVGHFYDVNASYWDKVNGLYDKLDNTEPADKGLIYNQIRNIKQQYSDNTTYQGHVLPTPEQYAWSIKTPEEQEGTLAGWATLPAEYLTEFERKQVGYSLTEAQQPKAEKLADYAFRVDQAYQEGLVRANKSYDTDAQARADKLVADRAAELGISKYWTETKAPNYVRVGSALKLGERTNAWNIISSWATDLRNQIKAAGQEPQSASGSMQQQAYGWFIQAVRNLHDAELNKILNMLGNELNSNRALAPEELLTHLFFDVYVR